MDGPDYPGNRPAPSSRIPRHPGCPAVEPDIVCIRAAPGESHGGTPGGATIRVMNSPGANPLLERLRTALDAQPGLQVAIVFGSAAAGRTEVDSDVDVAVLADRALDPARRSELIRLIADVTGRPVDLVDLRTAGPVVLRSVLHDGHVLITRDRRALDQLWSRMLTDAEDFLPYRQRMLRERRNAWIR